LTSVKENQVDEKKNDHEVGYRKPPKKTRYQKGQSGNPKGRPRGSRSWATLLREILSERVEVRENGGTRIVTKKELILRYAVNKAATGDSRAREFLVNQTPWLQRDLAEPKRSPQYDIEAFERAREILRGLSDQHAHGGCRSRVGSRQVSSGFRRRLTVPRGALRDRSSLKKSFGSNA
jgi:hypothetical protein